MRAFPPADREIVGAAVASWLYVVFYAGVAALVRIRLGGGGARNWLARATLPVLLMAGVLLRVVRNFRTGDFVRVEGHFGRV